MGHLLEAFWKAEMLLVEQAKGEGYRSSCLKLVTHSEGRSGHQSAWRSPLEAM